MKVNPQDKVAERWRHGAPWLGLVSLAGLFSAALSLIHFPAASLLGSMIAGVMFAVSGVELRFPRPLFLLAQGIAGCLIAKSLTPETFWSVVSNWPVLLVFIAATLSFSFAISWALRRFGAVSAETAIWAAMPGMSGAMVIIAQERDADGRVVALVQYVRLAMVVVSVTLVSHFSSGSLPNGLPPEMPSHPVLALGITLLIALLGPLATRWLGFIPAAAMMVPLVSGAALGASGVFHLWLPDGVLLLAFAAIGLEVGLRFTRSILIRIVQLIPLALLAALVLISLSGMLSLVLSYLLGIDKLTAFLATVPGSIDSVAIVAIESHVDVSFVLALQTVRMFVVVLCGPFLVQQLQRLPGWQTKEER
ncbi:AbrB family transcriptional regulator [Acerihabitans sp. TG2]|uniref:AbrB family transcriptional regulator n=1 Tax=Acerihabitans sp. TG2 TaxID=3096008 RepID=UPI002B23EDBA|nr:AbrB family transcriptional regulator [Acerihabitans sp. TG2]MEA9391258.1 AbrB family transcriptional regulator [Acerihabitans sp. TG2]